MIIITQKNSSHLNFLVRPRDFLYSTIKLHEQTFNALQIAASIIQEKSNNSYTFVVTRGYVSWGAWRVCRASFAKILFKIFFSESKNNVDLLFSANGHDDGFSVDVSLFDLKQRKIIKLLSWRNVFISTRHAQHIQKENKELLALLNGAMNQAGFIAHTDPREKLQSHYRLQIE